MAEDILSKSFLLTKHIKTTQKIDVSLIDVFNIIKKYPDKPDIFYVEKLFSEPSQKITINETKKTKNHIVKFLNKNMLKDLMKFFPKNYKRSNIVLDTHNQTLSNLKYGKLSWKVNYENIFIEGSVAFDPNMNFIHGIKLGGIKFLKNSLIETLGNSKNYHLSILIDEFSSQSFVGTDGKLFHFLQMYKYQYNGEEPLSVEVSPYGHNDGYFWFNKPFQSLHTITLTLGDPMIEIPFDNNFIKCKLVQNSNPMELIPINKITYTTLYYMNNQLQISGFTTGNPVADTVLISSINNQIININNIYKDTNDIVTSFELSSIDVSSMTPRENDIEILLFSKEVNRYIIPLELIYS